MKIKFAALALGAALLTANLAHAEDTKSKATDDHFAERKAQMLKDLNDDKAGTDQVISCVNSAQKYDDMKKCYALRKENIAKIRERNKSEYEHSKAERKEHLQNALKKIDEEDKGTKK